MKLKNEALQELYGTIVNCTITISPYAGFDSPIDKAFKECDEKLSGSATFEHIKNLQDRFDMLQQDHESDVRVIGKLHSQMVNLEDEKTEQEKRADILKSQRDMFKKEIEQLKKEKQWLEQSKHAWIKTAIERGKKLNAAEASNRELQKKLDEANADITDLQNKKLEARDEEVEQLKKQLDGALEAKEAVNNSRYKWAQKWLSTKQNLEAELNKAEVKYRRLEKEHEELSIENKRLQNNVRAGYDQGQTDLWVKLQDVKDMQPNEFDVECECLGDVIDMDLEDFLDVYKKWWEQKEIDRMREWLVDFCWGRVCEGCPLESKEYKCGCGYSFSKTGTSDLRIIPDKDIKRYYEKARGCGLYTLKDAKLFATTVEGVNRAITKACEGFCEAVKDANIKITENLRNGYTLKATADVDKDLLMKVCGVKPEEEKPNPEGLVITTRGVTTVNYTEATMNAIKEAVRKFEKSLPALDSWESTITGSIKVDDILGNIDNTEHKLEYGDAVRVPWRDYDYMYIGPEAKHIRLFDPKSHTVIFVSPSEKLKYQGCKVVICDEEDLRKIWKYKK